MQGWPLVPQAGLFPGMLQLADGEGARRPLVGVTAEGEHRGFVLHWLAPARPLAVKSGDYEWLTMRNRKVLHHSLLIPEIERMVG